MNRNDALEALDDFLLAVENCRTYADDTAYYNQLASIVAFRFNRLAQAARFIRREFSKVNKAECLAFAEAQRRNSRGNQTACSAFASEILEALEVLP